MKIFLVLLCSMQSIFAQEYGAMCMSYPRALIYNVTNIWNGSSSLQKLLMLALIVLTIFWVIWRIIKCGWGGCGCSCKGSCHCTL